MTTLQTIPRHPHRLRSPLGAGLFALSALIAIGVAVLFLTLTGAHRTTTQSPTITGTQASAHAAPAIAPDVWASHGSAGYFRDPTTHALLRIHTIPCDGSALRVEKSCRITP